MTDADSAVHMADAAICHWAFHDLLKRPNLMDTMEGAKDRDKIQSIHNRFFRDEKVKATEIIPPEVLAQVAKVLTHHADYAETAATAAATKARNTGKAANTSSQPSSSAKKAAALA